MAEECSVTINLADTVVRLKLTIDESLREAPTLPTLTLDMKRKPNGDGETRSDASYGMPLLYKGETLPIRVWYSSTPR